MQKINTQRLIEIAGYLGLQSIVSSLKELADKEDVSSCPIVFPLVGEFSAGKTSLINALTDSRQLETATKPTTATIYEIFFGNNVSYAEVYDTEGRYERRVDDVTTLKNSELTDASLVKVFDTSQKISSSIVIVDTPGLSAPNPTHRQALVDYLPKADGVLLVSDINQQLTASLLSFIKTAKLANRPIFLVITQCDLKANSEVEAARKYAASVSGIPLENIVCVSAYKGQLEELYSLLSRIQSDKAQILSKVNAYRAEELKSQILNVLEQLIKTSEPNSDYSEVIREQQNKLNSLKHEIESVVEAITNDIETISRDSARKFEDQVYDQLDSLAASDGVNYDVEAKALVDSTLRVMFNDYKVSIQNLLFQKAHETFTSDGSIDLSGLIAIDLRGLELGEMPYNLNLNNLGHKYDKMIATGVKIASAVAITAAVVSTGGAAAGAVGAAGAATAEAAGAAELASAGVNAAATLSKIKKGYDFISNTSDKYREVEAKNHAHTERGAIESLVGTITDRSLGKPQRRRAIHQYVDLTLAPSYKQGLQSITALVVKTFSDAIQNSAANRMEEMTTALHNFKKAQEENETTYKERIHQLKDYQSELLLN